MSRRAAELAALMARLAPRCGELAQELPRQMLGKGLPTDPMDFTLRLYDATSGQSSRRSTSTPPSSRSPSSRSRTRSGRAAEGLRRPATGADRDRAGDHRVCKTRIARFKAPAAVEISDQLPKTSTGKVQKFLLRDKEWAANDTLRRSASVIVRRRR